VINVLPDSPAESAGVKTGDIISKLDNDTIINNKDFNTKLMSLSRVTKSNSK